MISNHLPIFFLDIKIKEKCEKKLTKVCVIVKCLLADSEHGQTLLRGDRRNDLGVVMSYSTASDHVLIVYTCVSADFPTKQHLNITILISFLK